MRATGKTFILILAVLAVVGAAPAMGERHVLPVVVSGVEGVNGSYWETEVRILRLSASDPASLFTVRRVWVATEAGGFEDDQATAPVWSMDESTGVRALILMGDQLLSGTTATHGAVGLETSGHALVMVRNANSGDLGVVPPPTAGGPVPCCLPGNGQAAVSSDALVGPSVIAWGDGGTNDYFRMNVGLVNPTDKPLHVTLGTYFLGFAGPGPSGAPPAGLLVSPSVSSQSQWLVWDSAVPLNVDLPPWGWRQLNDLTRQLGCTPEAVDPPQFCKGLQPLYLTIAPDADAPYYAYGSVIYSPLNDPEFVPAVAGTVENP